MEAGGGGNNQEDAGGADDHTGIRAGVERLRMRVAQPQRFGWAIAQLALRPMLHACVRLWAGPGTCRE